MRAKVAELADAPDLGSGAARRGGSSPPFRTNSLWRSFDAPSPKVRGCSGFRQQAPASLTPANRLNLGSGAANRGGSSPPFRTITNLSRSHHFLISRGLGISTFAFQFWIVEASEMWLDLIHPLRRLDTLWLNGESQLCISA